MISLKECNEAIVNLQKALKRVNLAELERISYYDTLTFYLDIRALLVMRGCKDKTTKEEEN
nr:MAG TPA: hypothetical protein [Caudoviricetes sp.]